MENVRTAQGLTLTQKIQEYIKKPLQYAIIIGALIIGFLIGRLEYKY